MSPFPLLLVAALIGAAPASDPPAGPKVLIYVDMDGSSGVARPIQAFYPYPEYFASRRFITADLNAAIRGLKAGGAGEIVVTDAHGSSNDTGPDVIVEKMDRRATFLFRDQPYDPYLEAMDSSFQAIVCVGMHARAGSAGFMAHTGTLEPTYTVNGARISESAMIAIAAARFGIPVIMIAGDDVLRDQNKEELPLAQYAVVQRARSRALADTLPQPVVQVAIERAARAAIEKLSEFQPYPVAPAYRFEIAYQNPLQADLAGIVAGTTRIDSLTLGFTTPTFAEGLRKGGRMLEYVALDRNRWLFPAAGVRPDAAVRRRFLELLITNWLEPEKLPKPPAPKARPAKRRYWGATEE
jgi:D-amino peptidase